MALKFCGGCDPGYDRPVYWSAVQARAQGRIDWVTLDEADYEAVLIINNCDTACLTAEYEAGELGDKKPVKVVSISDDRLDPALLVEEILG